MPSPSSEDTRHLESYIEAILTIAISCSKLDIITQVCRRGGATLERATLEGRARYVEGGDSRGKKRL